MIPEFRAEINYPEAKPEWKQALLDCVETDLSQLIRNAPWVSMILANLEVIGITSRLANISVRRLSLNCWPKAEGNEAGTCYYEYPKPERYTLLNHLVTHLVFKHTFIPEGLDDGLVVISQDATVNNAIKNSANSKLSSFPGHITTNSAGDTLIIGEFEIKIPQIDSLDWKELYNILFDHGLDTTGWESDIENDPNILPEEIEKFEDKVISVLTQMEDKIPDPYKRHLWKMLTPKVTWADKIRMILNSIVGRTDFSYNPNPRKIHIGILPTITKPAGGTVFLAFDTSASMSREEVEQGIAEARQIQKQFGCAMEIIVCDQEVTKIHSFDGSSELGWADLEMPGQRGTSFVPVFDYIAETKGPAPSVLVYCTDLEGHFPDKGPSYPVIWLTKNQNHPVPFGKIVLV